MPAHASVSRHLCSRAFRAAGGALLLVAGAAWLQGCGSSHATPVVAPQIHKRTSPPLKAKHMSDAVPDVARGRIVHNIKTAQKVFALTFDDGPQPRYTHEVLDILRANHIRATFFQIGVKVKQFPRIARDVSDAGHVIGNHTWSHPSHPENARAEFDNTDAILTRVHGKRPNLFRPPYGLIHNGLADVAKAHGDAVILWNSVGADWSKKATSGSIVSQILRLAKPGGIALLHDGGGNRSATVAALPRIIDALRAQGYRFVTVPELLRIGPPDTMSEAQFWKKNGLKLKNGRVEKAKGKM